MASDDLRELRSRLEELDDDGAIAAILADVERARVTIEALRSHDDRRGGD